MEQLRENLVQLRRADFQFDNWVALIGEDQVSDVGHNTNFPLHPAHYWTHIADEQYVNFIGRIENFEEDFRAFLALVNIAQVEPVNANVVELQGSAAKTDSATATLIA